MPALSALCADVPSSGLSRPGWLPESLCIAVAVISLWASDLSGPPFKNNHCGSLGSVLYVNISLQSHTLMGGLCAAVSDKETGSGVSRACPGTSTWHQPETWGRAFSENANRRRVPGQHPAAGKTPKGHEDPGVRTQGKRRENRSWQQHQ